MSDETVTRDAYASKKLKFSGPKKSGSKKNLGQKIIVGSEKKWVAKSVGPKKNKFFVQMNLGPKKNWAPKKFWLPKNWVPKKKGQQRFGVQKFGPENIFCHKIGFKKPFI